MSLKAVEVITVSDSEKEEEKYLTIFYQNSSATIQVPIEDDGKVILSDVNTLEPNFCALSLTNAKTRRLIKPNNGFFKEPKEGWENFKIFAVLKDVENVSHLTVPPHTVKSEPDESSSNIADIIKNENGKKEAAQNAEKSSSFSPASNNTEKNDSNEAAQSESLVADKVTDHQTGNGNKSYDFLINRFYPQSQIDNAKENLRRRIIKAKLNLHSQDPLFLEKFLFLRKTFMQHPFIKDIFPTRMVCRSCDHEKLRTFNNVVQHVFSKKHMIQSLNQKELNKICQAFSCIHHSATGYYYVTASLENRKRRAQEDGKEKKKLQKK